MPRLAEPIEVKLANYKVDERCCWLWLGSLDSEGYSRTNKYPGQNLLAHRESVRLQRGLIPGTVCHHLCRVRRCINPFHIMQIAKFIHDMLPHGF